MEVLLGYNIRWLEEGGFTSHRGRWLYALLVKLEKPLIPEMCSLLRNLARTCIKLRSQLPSPDNPSLLQLNLFICLVGRYFDQTDLADQWGSLCNDRSRRRVIIIKIKKRKYCLNAISFHFIFVIFPTFFFSFLIFFLAVRSRCQHAWGGQSTFKTTVWFLLISF